MVSVLICTCERPDLLVRTLESLRNCQRPSQDVTVVVVENGPERGVEAVVTGFAAWFTTRYARLPTPGLSLARNHGLTLIDDGLVVLLDDDVRLDPGTLVAYERAAARAGTGAFFGGPVGIDYEETPPPWLLPWLPPSARGWRPGEVEQEMAEPCFIGLNWAAHRSDLVAAGGFDNQFGPGGSTGSPGHETDMQRRLLAAGRRAIYVPDAQVWHYVPRSRCSPDWALERARRTGIWQGLAESNGVPRLFGYPRWTLPAWIVKSARAAIVGPFVDDERRFRLQRDVAVLEGFARGSREAHKRSRS